MRRVLVLLCLGLVLPPTAHAATAAPTGRLLVTLKRGAATAPGARGATAHAVAAAAGARPSGFSVPQIRLVTVAPQPGETVGELAHRLRADPRVASVAPERKATLRFQPNDPALVTPEAAKDTVPGTMDADSYFVAGGINTCGQRGTPVPAQAFYNRGAVAERLLYRDFEAIGASPRGRAAPVFAPVSDYYVRYAEEYARAALSMLDMASCVVRADPQRSYGFFRTPRGSAAERGEIAALMPAISGCVARGENIDLSPPIFRAFLAEAAYRAAAGRPEVFRTE